MTKYLFQRTLLLIPTLFFITLVSFFIVQMAPGGPLEAKLMRGGGDTQTSVRVTAEAKQALIELYGFDKPMLTRYFIWLGQVLTFDFGISFFEYRPVSTIIWERLKVALLFGIPSILMLYSLSILIGTYQAIRRGGWLDRMATSISFIFYSVPSMVVAIVLVLFFSVYLDWLPVIGLHSDDAENMGSWEYLVDLAKHFILPFSCYVIGGFAFLQEIQKRSMLDELKKDYMRTARAKGASESRIHYHHGLRNAAIPMITSLQAIFVMLLGGSFVIENIFTIPGLGQLGFDALLSRDYPVIMGNLTLTAMLGMISVLLVDFLYAVADPRIHFD